MRLPRGSCLFGGPHFSDFDTRMVSIPKPLGPRGRGYTTTHHIDEGYIPVLDTILNSIASTPRFWFANIPEGCRSQGLGVFQYRSGVSPRGEVKPQMPPNDCRVGFFPEAIPRELIRKGPRESFEIRSPFSKPSLPGFPGLGSGPRRAQVIGTLPRFAALRKGGTCRVRRGIAKPKRMRTDSEHQ